MDLYDLGFVGSCGVCCMLYHRRFVDSEFVT
jgi:hypothetical protein